MSEQAQDEVIETLLTLIVDDLKDESQQQLEPYELYLNRVRMQLYHDYKAFVTRFKAGHQALIDELGNDAGDDGRIG